MGSSWKVYPIAICKPHRLNSYRKPREDEMMVTGMPRQLDQGENGEGRGCAGCTLALRESTSVAVVNLGVVGRCTNIG